MYAPFQKDWYAVAAQSNKTTRTTQNVRTITIRQLIDLVEGDPSSARACIQKVFEWQFERNMSIVRWALGVSASLAIAISVAYFRSDQALGVAEFRSGLILSLVSATYGLYVLIRLRLMSSHFTAAIALHSKLKRIEDFIGKYRA